MQRLEGIVRPYSVTRCFRAKLGRTFGLVLSVTALVGKQRLLAHCDRLRVQQSIPFPLVRLKFVSLGKHRVLFSAGPAQAIAGFSHA